MHLVANSKVTVPSVRLRTAFGHIVFYRVAFTRTNGMYLEENSIERKIMDRNPAGKCKNRHVSVTCVDIREQTDNLL